ncbi:MAG: SLBB domain-containing protein [Ginsengibacter sp.]
MFACKKSYLIKSLNSLLFIFCFFLVTSQTAFCQVPVEIPGQIDPNDLKEATPAELMNYLKDKNKDQKNAGEDIHRKRLDNSPQIDLIAKDSLQRDNIQKPLDSPQNVYGSKLFQNSSIVQLAELSTPPPDYPIGVGDHIIVSLWGGADVEIDYVVARDGSIFPQGLGKITVQGLTFETAKGIITDRFRRVTPNSTNISVTMGQPRTIVINVTGEVNNPGPVVVSAFSNALNVLAIAGGLSEYGDLRNIVIKRAGKVIDSLDVYRYLTTGDFGKHLYMENNDFVIVNVYAKKVLASGQFKRPMYYQLKASEGFKDLLTYAGGFTSSAYASGGIIIRNQNEKEVIKNVNFNAIGLKTGSQAVDEPLYNGDVIVINAINPGLINKVIVKGEVAYPNIYEIRNGDRLFDVINRAGGITPNAYIQRAYVYKGAGDSINLNVNKIDVKLTDLNKNLSSPDNVLLGPNDVIEIFSRSQFTDRETVSIEGEVRLPRTIQRYGGLTLKDLIYLANGLKPSAEFGRIEVSSIVDIDSAQQGIKPTKTIIKSYAILPKLELDSVTQSVILRPFDQVFVRKNPAFEFQQNVSLEGQFKYPGRYSRLEKNENLSSYIERAGGLRADANIGGAILYRNKSAAKRADINARTETKYIRDSLGNVTDSVLFNPEEPVSIDLYRAMKYKNSKYDIVLQSGDIVFIPEINPIVSVTGNVQSPLKIYFDKNHNKLSYYIDKAGGFGLKPWRERIFVTYANGRSRRTKNFGFFHFYPKVEEGSTVTVPFKPKPINPLQGLTSALIKAAVPIFTALIISKFIK